MTHVGDGQELSRYDLSAGQSTRGVVHAAFDLDALGIVLLNEPLSRELHYRNLATIYNNCVEAGVESFVIAAAIESREVLNDLTRAMGNASATVCRLIAPLDTMMARLQTREVGCGGKSISTALAFSTRCSMPPASKTSGSQTMGRASPQSPERCLFDRIGLRLTGRPHQAAVPTNSIFAAEDSCTRA